jgi:hypothetical protein
MQENMKTTQEPKTEAIERKNMKLKIISVEV